MCHNAAAAVFHCPGIAREGHKMGHAVLAGDKAGKLQGTRALRASYSEATPEFRFYIQV